MYGWGKRDRRRFHEKQKKKWMSHQKGRKLQSARGGELLIVDGLAKAHIDVMSDAAENKVSSPGTWAVLRQDDNGNRFVVAAGLSREEAERLVARYESLEHKQMYWVDQDRK
jgi:hypothetical protein